MPESHTDHQVLVIEDDLGFVKILSYMNRDWQLPLTICSNRAEIETALEDPSAFSVVVSDCHVPRIDILERLGELRTTHPEIDVVLMSNLDERELQEEGEGLAPALIEPKDRIIREPAGFATRIRQLLARHDA